MLIELALSLPIFSNLGSILRIPDDAVLCLELFPILNPNLSEILSEFSCFADYPRVSYSNSGVESIDL